MAAVLTVLAMLLGLVGVAGATTTPAVAAVNKSIAIKDLKIVRSTTTGTPDPGQIRVWDAASLSFTWDARNADLKDGDSFTISLGEAFSNQVHPLTQAMKVKDGDTEVEVATCELTEKDITCTFNSKVDELRAKGFTGFSGDGSAILKAVKTTTEAKAPITVNGETVDVEIDGGPVIVRYEGSELSKWADAVNKDSKSIRWGIQFGSDYLKDAMAKAGKTLPLDGTTRSTITLTDTVGEGHAFSTEMSEWVLVRADSAAQPGASRDLTNAAGTDFTNDYGDFDMSVAISGSTATITITGPFAESSNYRVNYSSVPTSANHTINPGQRYSNTATLTDTGRSATSTQSYINTFTITVKMERGYGGFDVTKYLEGDGAADVPGGTTFSLGVAYTLPEGRTADDYPDWKAPGTLNDTRTGGTTTLVVTVGEKVPYPETFPIGTMITLTEDTSSVSPSQTQVAWAEPVFVVEGEQTATFTIKDQVSTPVELTNKATLVGTLAIVKRVSGVTDTTKEFTFTYDCAGTTGSVTVKGDGTAVAVPGVFPVGTSCTVTEDTASAGVPGYTLTAPAPQTVTVVKGSDPLQVSFANDYTRDTGTFSVSKTVTGGESTFAQASFSFPYTCTDAQGTEVARGSLSVPGDGQPTTSPRIPVGATCSLSEDADSAARTGYSVETTLSRTEVTIGEKDANVEVTATNSYTRDTGTFLVKKLVPGEGAAFNGQDFDVDYTCKNVQGTEVAKGTLQVTAGEDPTRSPSIPTGSTCTLSESDTTRERAGYAVTTTVSDPSITIAKGTEPLVTVTNTYTRLTGSFTIAKTVSGDGAPLAPTEFVFGYQCYKGPDATGETTVSGQVAVQAGQQPVTVSDVPTGSCRITEQDASAALTTLASTLSVNGTPVTGSSAVVVVAEGTPVAVNATNTYTLNRGDFSVAKKVEGDDAAALAERSFTLDYTCTSDVEGEVTGTLSVPGDGTVVAGPSLPVGATCTVNENATSAIVDGYNVLVPETQTFTITEKDTTKALTFTNTYTRHAGTFSVAKSVSGLPDAATRSFSFAYTCDNGSQGSLTVPGDGTAVSVEALPLGISCTVTEDVQAAQVDGYELTAPQAQVVMVTEKDEVKTITFQNTYQAVPPAPSAPEPSASPSPSEPSGGDLARTGAPVLLTLGTACVLVTGGVLLRRRRQG